MGNVARLSLAFAAFALAGLLSAGAAHAQACVAPDEAPGDVYNIYLIDVGPFFPLPPALCEKLVSSATAACHRAVSDAQACLDRLIGSLYKAKKSACSTLKASDICVDEAKAQADDRRDDVATDAAGGHTICDEDFAPAIDLACNAKP